jgi:3-oxoadipate enol-lactonase
VRRGGSHLDRDESCAPCGAIAIASDGGQHAIIQDMIEEHIVDVIGRPVRYLETGSGWPMVLLHGFPLSADLWRPQLERRPDGWRMIAPDLRGLGPQGGPPAESIDQMASDVVGLLDELRLERAVIGGLSMGGYVTLALFRLAPERFTGMILANTRAGADSTEARAARDQMSARVRADGPSAVAEDMLPKLLGKTTRDSRPEIAGTVRALIEGNTVAGIDGAIQSMKTRADSTPLLEKIGRPALVITSDEDTLIPASEAEDMARRLPRAQLVTIPKAGHASNLEAPDDFSEALANFLRASL